MNTERPTAFPRSWKVSRPALILEEQMILAEKPKLLMGPYTSPGVKMGDAITCAVRGSVEVRGWHDKGAIGVPLGGVKGTRWSIVVSHDLLEALFVETSRAIQFYWAVSEPTVAGWRRALGIQSRQTASFVEAISRVGSVTGRAPGMAERLRAMNANPWRSDELRMLPMLSTAEIVRLTGRSRESVEHARSRYGLPQERGVLTCEVCGHSWLPQNGRTPRRCPKQSCRQPLQGLSRQRENV